MTAGWFGWVEAWEAARAAAVGEGGEGGGGEKGGRECGGAEGGCGEGGACSHDQRAREHRS